MTNQIINFYEEGLCNMAPAKWDIPAGDIKSIPIQYFSLLIPLHDMQPGVL